MAFSLYKNNFLNYNKTVKEYVYQERCVRMRSQKLRVVAVIVISLIMASLRTVIVTFNMEKNQINNDTYYLPDNVEVTAFTAVSIMFLLVFLFSGISLGRKKTVHLERTHGAMPAASLILSSSLFGAVLLYAASLLGNNTELSLIKLILFALAALSAVKFLVSGLRYNKKQSENIHAFAALAPILFSAVRILSDFISTSSAPLASSGAYHIVGLVAVLLYFLCEGKSYIAQTSAALFNSFGYSAVFFLLVYSVPNLYMHCFGSFSFDCDAAFSVVDLGLVVYIAARLSSAQIRENNC